ncbi:hypothetical protein L218DRAFT_930208 [Marasmius fiardii PR-910]|nr:hypothetical protein L218DRAFT_930208 [Marasmius fiardii PR-910]
MSSQGSKTSLSGDVAFVTGAASGIGLALTRKLVELGYDTDLAANNIFDRLNPDI